MVEKLPDGTTAIVHRATIHLPEEAQEQLIASNPEWSRRVFAYMKEKLGLAEGVNRRFIADAISQAWARQHPTDSRYSGLAEIDDDALLYRMEQMRLDGTASSKWKAARSLADLAANPNNAKVSSIADRLEIKYDKKYPGAVWPNARKPRRRT